MWIKCSLESILKAEKTKARFVANENQKDHRFIEMFDRKVSPFCRKFLQFEANSTNAISPIDWPFKSDQEKVRDYVFAVHAVMLLLSVFLLLLSKIILSSAFVADVSCVFVWDLLANCSYATKTGDTFCNCSCVAQLKCNYRKWLVFDAYARKSMYC